MGTVTISLAAALSVPADAWMEAADGYPHRASIFARTRAPEDGGLRPNMRPVLCLKSLTLAIFRPLRYAPFSRYTQ